MPFHFPMNTIDLRNGNSDTQRVIGIQDGAFEGSSIEKVYLPTPITTFSENAFANCKNLKRITYSKETENNLYYAVFIEQNAFKGCTKLDSLTISSNIIYIEGNAFANCNKDFKLIYTGSSSSWKEKKINPRVTVECNAYTVTYSSNNSITVWFNSKGGSYVASQTISKTTPLRYPTIPTKSGYVFAGWYKDEYYRTPFTFYETLNEDITLYAYWLEVAYGSNIITMNNSTGTTVNYNSSMQYYAFVPLVSQTITIYTTGDCDTRGYLYDSSRNQLQYNDDGGTNYNFNMSYAVLANTVYYIGVSFYSSNTESASTLYLTGSRTVPNSSVTVNPFYSKEVSYGSSYMIPYEYRSGYIFKGYYLEPTFKTQITDAYGASLEPWTFIEDITVYGKYE